VAAQMEHPADMTPPRANDDRATSVLDGSTVGIASSTAAGAIRLSAPAKINWILDILERRDDGYHELETVASTITLADEVVVSSRAGDSSILLTCNDPSVPTDDDNLACRAAAMLARRSGIRCGASIDLTKRIPAGAGLGGGSSDAAAVLRGLNRLWGLDWSLPRLLPIAAAIGSDVPLLMTGGTAVARGRGEFVEPLTFRWPGFLVVAMPALHVPTREVYAGVRREDLRVVSEAASVFGDGTAASRWTARELLERCRNGLEAAAFRRFDKLAELHAALRRACDRPWQLCGSGSSMFTACDSVEEAESCARTVRARFGIRAETARLQESGAMN